MVNMDDKVDIDHMGALMSLPPAPVVLVGVGDEEKNIITVGMFNVFSVRPPIIGIAVTTSRQSYKFLEENDEFTINIPGKELLEHVITCGEKSGADTDKFKLTGLTPVKGKRTKAPRIAECLMNIELKKLRSFEVGDHTWYLGEIKHTDITSDYDRSKALLYWDGEYWTAGERPIKERE
ncbi:MAG: flavin reductase family protein [Methanomassiliicoccus sp.]|nr:MAG: flavin reductase family protein [Methanomassiliicoccus sp.]